MSVVAGKKTIGTTGSVSIYFGPGAVVNELELYPENSPSNGYANAGYQFSRTPGKASDYTKQVYYNAAGTKVLEFTVTGGWGTDTAQLNVTMQNTSHPLAVVARS